ncbi:hypothetical protein QQ045_017824 [Rhodiola kirilowii]
MMCMSLLISGQAECRRSSGWDWRKMAVGGGGWRLLATLEGIGCFALCWCFAFPLSEFSIMRTFIPTVFLVWVLFVGPHGFCVLVDLSIRVFALVGPAFRQAGVVQCCRVFACLSLAVSEKVVRPCSRPSGAADYCMFTFIFIVDLFPTLSPRIVLSLSLTIYQKKFSSRLCRGSYTCNITIMK